MRGSGLTMTKAGDKVYVGGGSRAAVYEFSFAGRRAQAFAHVSRRRGERSKARGFHRRRAACARWPSALRRRSLSRFGGRDQSAIGLRAVAHSRPGAGLIAFCFILRARASTFRAGPMVRSASTMPPPATGLRLSRVAPHTTDMVWLERRAWKTSPKSRRAFSFRPAIPTTSTCWAPTKTGELSQLETINLALTPRQPLGITPSGLGLSADGKQLFVACADANAAAVVDISGAAQPRRWVSSRPAGIPRRRSGLPDGRLAVLNGRGLQSYPNPGGPNPMKRPSRFTKAPRRLNT